MSITSIQTSPPIAREAIAEWNEPAGATARGTVIVLAGRGEAAGVYERFGRRISADAYQVRVVADATTDVEGARAQVAELLSDTTLPQPTVLVGSDAGAALALTLLPHAPARLSAAVLVGLPIGSDDGSGVDDAEVRSACPVHRRTLSDPRLVTAGALSRPLPESLASALTRPAGAHSAVRVPVLAIHGDADTVAPAPEALTFYRSLPGARILTISGGKHDALNDVSHRSVAAAIILFLERVRLATATTATVDGDDRPDALPRVLLDGVGSVEVFA
jgi:alpha-beta hydrolase superfamily lysophospholipase